MQSERHSIQEKLHSADERIRLLERQAADSSLYVLLISSIDERYKFIVLHHKAQPAAGDSCGKPKRANCRSQLTERRPCE